MASAFMEQETRQTRRKPANGWGRTPRKLVTPYQCRKTLAFHNLDGSVDALLEDHPKTREWGFRAQKCQRPAISDRHVRREDRRRREGNEHRNAEPPIRPSFVADWCVVVVVCRSLVGTVPPA